LEQATKALEVAQINLDKATITSPIDGIDVTVDIQEGDYVPAYDYYPTTPIYIIDPKTMEINAQIDEIDIASVKIGQKVIISLDSIPDMSFNGIVKSIAMSPAADSQSSGVVVYEVKIGFVNSPPAEAKVGMSATVDIVTDEHQNVLQVPNRAIQYNNQGKSMINVLVNGKTETKDVQTGISDGITTEIIGGVNAGDTVIITRTPEAGLFGQ